MSQTVSEVLSTPTWFFKMMNYSGKESENLLSSSVNSDGNCILKDTHKKLNIYMQSRSVLGSEIFHLQECWVAFLKLCGVYKTILLCLGHFRTSSILSPCLNVNNKSCSLRKFLKKCYREQYYHSLKTIAIWSSIKGRIFKGFPLTGKRLQQGSEQVFST